MTDKANNGRVRLSNRAVIAARYGDDITRASASRLFTVWDNATTLEARELESFESVARHMQEDEGAL